jgi:hypothetical protein
VKGRPTPASDTGFAGADLEPPGPVARLVGPLAGSGDEPVAEPPSPPAIGDGWTFDGLALDVGDGAGEAEPSGGSRGGAGGWYRWPLGNAAETGEMVRIWTAGTTYASAPAAAAPRSIVRRLIPTDPVGMGSASRSSLPMTCIRPHLGPSKRGRKA